jgi:hypothetical protein
MHETVTRERMECLPLFKSEVEESVTENFKINPMENFYPLLLARESAAMARPPSSTLLFWF